MRSLESWLLPGVVLGMLALAGFGTWFLARPCCAARMTRPEGDMLAISSALKAYRLNGGHYPTTEQGLEALATRPTTEPLPTRWVKILDGVLRDQWGNGYRYRLLPEEDAREFEIISMGKDGQLGTEDDISSLDPPP